jgi:hypothetical protein
MGWKGKLGLQLVLAIPAFSGYPLNSFPHTIVPGITLAAALYFAALNAIIRLIQGPRRYANIIAVAALITLPVVFVGGAISYLFYLTGVGGPDSDPYGFGAHYLALCLTMLTVIPLALSLVVSLPIHTMEADMLTPAKGVGRGQKKLLMALRVFNHIVYYVIPEILEVVREERRLRPVGGGRAPSCLSDRMRLLAVGGRALIGDLIQIAVEGICAAVQHIPLWAVEISQLPPAEKHPQEDPQDPPPLP